MKLTKILSSIMAAAMLVSISVSASVLGTGYIEGYTVQIGQDAYFTNNKFLSDQSGVGYQTENYISYTPNEGITPIIGYGTSVYGSLTKTLSEGNRLISKGDDIIGGINADYFSFKTGVPMSNLIVGGEVISKDSSATYGFGVDENGKGFIGENYIETVLTRADGRTLNIECINKYRQPYAMYLMNGKFSDQTHNTTLGLDIIIEADTDKFMPGETIKGKVIYAECYNGSIKIPEGTLVLTVDVNAPMFDQIADIAVGEEIEISIDTPTEPRWKTAIIGMGSTGEYILSGGVVTPGLAAGAAPRTAVGLTESGDIILYTIDGRQTGYSYGVQLKTLAARMKELGCVEAVNLDGGGSTSIVAKLPGEDGLVLMNKPSDGSQRAVSTSIFLKNNLPSTGIIGQIQIYPALKSYVMKGASVQLYAKATDTGYHPMDASGMISFSVEDGKASTIDQNGYFTAKDAGTVYAIASVGEVYGTHEVECIESPDEITVKDEATGNKISSIKIKRGDSINLTASAAYYYHDVIANDGCFIWSASDNIGTINANGEFYATDNLFESGFITVSAGSTSVTIPVEVTENGNEDESLFYPQIDAAFDGKALSGTITSKYGFKISPENIKITFDGTPVTPVYSGGSFICSSAEPPHKIRITVTNDKGYTSAMSITASDPSTLDNPFSDTENSWARDILSYMYSQKLVNGEATSKGLVFNPQKEMTRAEFAVMVCNYLKINTQDYEGVTLPYSDLSSIPNWALGQFRALYSLGILSGRGDGTGKVYADPNNGISRAEAFTIVSRLLPSGLKKAEITATDKSDIPSWAEDGFKILIADGTVSGYEDGSLLPLKKLTKAEAAKLLYGLY